MLAAVLPVTLPYSSEVAEWLVEREGSAVLLVALVRKLGVLAVEALQVQEMLRRFGA